jgi:hypothetical protein
MSDDAGSSALERAPNADGPYALADAYAFLQKAVGLIAVTLPFVVVIGNLVTGGSGLKGSISAYYYTHVGSYFVGSLFALGVFFLSYNYKPLPQYELDNVLSSVASLMAVGVALFPTANDVDTAAGGAKVVSTLHLVFAGVLFGLLAYFALFLFTKSDAVGSMTAAKRRRNRLYRICGVVIVVALVLIGLAQVLQPPSSWHAVLFLESAAVIAFGVSWLVKGRLFGILADAPGSR